MNYGFTKLKFNQALVEKLPLSAVRQAIFQTYFFDLKIKSTSYTQNIWFAFINTFHI